MKRLELKEKYIKDFGKILTHDDFYEIDSINERFSKYLSEKYENADTYIKPYGCFCPDKKEDSINSFIVYFNDRNCIIGKHCNGIILDFIREPNNDNNFSYIAGNTWLHNKFVEDGRRFFDGSDRYLSYKLAEDVFEFFKNY
jgi:hypothetical protein